MCCTCTVSPIVPETAEAILALGQFTLKAPGIWERKVTEDDGDIIIVTAMIAANSLKLSLFPTITTAVQHRRVSGGVYFEIACKVAEKCGSTIVQSSNVTECVENSERKKLLASYPNEPMSWAAVCVGFQRACLPGD